jgi:hypothetical protein
VDPERVRVVLVEMTDEGVAPFDPSCASTRLERCVSGVELRWVLP